MRRNDIRNAALCALVVLAAFLLTNPFAEIAFNDDWTYAFTVRELLRVGRVTYHAGESPALLTQAYWGALIARLFGFSFVSLRFSTLPFAMGSAGICYLLARRANLRPSLAIFAALLLALSPLFLPLATSFMTDVPALCFILVSIYAFALAAEGQRPLIALAVAYGVGLIGGLDRQIVWIVPVACGPYVAWLRRKDKRVLIASAAGIAINLIAALLLSRWFYAQPFVISEWSLSQTLRTGVQTWKDSTVLWLCLWLTTVLLVMPATVPAAWDSVLQTCTRIRSRRGVIAFAIAIGLAVISLPWPGIAIEPWLGDVVSRRGALSGMELSGYRPVDQPLILREALALAVIVIAWALLTEFADRLLRPRLFQRIAGYFDPTDNRIAGPLLILVAAAYLALIAYRAPRAFIFDRYSLPLIPCAAILLLLRAQSARPRRVAMGLAWTLLGVWAVYGIAATQDVHALQAARQTAMDRLLAGGVPDIAIANGSECDNWTQLVHQGYINMPGINSPPGKYDPNLGPCPILRCLYRVEFQLSNETVPSRFGTVDYISWLPPFHRRIFIDRFADPTWLDPRSAAAAPKDFEQFHFH